MKVATFAEEQEELKKEDQKNNYCVYKHTAPDGRIYIGITGNDPKKRWNNGSGYRTNSYFTRCIKKYGWDNFEHSILFDKLTKKEAQKIEIELIKKYKCNNRKFGFNITAGGEARNGAKLSEKHKRLIREGNLGKIVSEETRKKLSQKTKKQWENKEYQNHMREVNLGKNNPQYGKKRTDEEKIKRGAKGIIQFTLDGEKIAEYISLHEAHEKTGASRYDISKCCKGIFKQSRGYIWKYKE